MGTVPALAEDTAGIELTGKAEKATATKSEVLILYPLYKTRSCMDVK